MDGRHESLFWHLFGGTRGGINRIRLLKLLSLRPYNLNQAAKELGLDYKTAAHHLEILQKNSLVQKGGQKYGGMFELTEFARANGEVLEGIWGRIGGK